MAKRLRGVLMLVPLLAAMSTSAVAQEFDILGTRAQGMGGAFVAVVDDASATYWNPGGLALGHVFSAALDRKVTEVNAGSLDDVSRHDTGSVFAVGMPVLGFSYYLLQTRSVTPAGTMLFRYPQGGETPVRVVRLDKLTTHHTGVTLVQSLFRGVAVGTTLKLVHGEVATSIVPEGDRHERLDDAGGLATQGTSKFDADVGIMAGGGRLKVGLTVRNLTQPSFPVTGTSDSLHLRRQARAGVAVSFAEGWAAASDFDLTENGPSDAPIRAFAAGTEGRLTRKIFVRSGFRFSTVGKSRPSLSAGGSYSVLSSVWIDGQVQFVDRPDPCLPKNLRQLVFATVTGKIREEQRVLPVFTLTRSAVTRPAMTRPATTRPAMTRPAMTRSAMTRSTAVATTTVAAPGRLRRPIRRTRRHRARGAAVTAEGSHGYRPPIVKGAVENVSHLLRLIFGRQRDESETACLARLTITRHGDIFDARSRGFEHPP